MSYVPRLSKVVNVLAIRQVKQGTETTCVDMLSIDLIFTILNYILSAKD